MQEKEPPKKAKRGFAAMSDEKRREIARMGGKAAHEQGTAHKWNSEEARQAGKKGGMRRKDEQGRDEG